MQISARARLVSIIIAVVFMFGALAGTGTYLIINHINKANATTETTLSVSGNLYNTDGAINGSAATEFLDKLDFITDGAEYKSPTIADRAGVRTNSFIFQMGYYVSPSGAMTTSKPITWQAVYARNGYLTIWMTQPYTNGYYNYNGRTVNAFDPGNDHSGSSNSGYYSNYSMSQLRDITKNIYTLLSNKFTTLNTIITAPSTASSAWQSSQNDVYTTADSSDYAHHNGLGSYSGSYSWGSSTGTAWSSCMSDVFWIPSAYEVFNTASGSGDRSDTNGLWGLTAADNGFSTTTLDGSSTSYCWLRSGFSNNLYYAMLVNSSGSATFSLLFNGHGVRPACHISLTSLYEATRSEIIVQANDNSFGIVSGGNGIFDYNEPVTITATPNIGYVFDHWELNGQTVDGAGATYTFNATTTSQTYTAIFRLAQTTITSSSGSSDIIAQYSDSNNISQEYLLHFASGRYLHNMNINDFTLVLEYTSLTLTNFDFCTAIEYVVNDNATQLYLKIIGLTSDLNITLSLADLPPPLQPATSGGGVDTVAVVSTYGGSAEIVGDSFADDSQITLVARNKINGYQFVGWFVGNSSTPISTAMSVRLNYSDIQGKVITARFEPIDSSTNNSQTDNNQTSDFA